MKKKIALFLCAALAVLLGGCRVHVPLGLGGYITGEEYPDAEKYRTGAFSYSADEISAVEVYWRCGEVEIVESDGAELAVRESGSELPEGSAMHFLLDGGAELLYASKSGKMQTELVWERKGDLYVFGAGEGRLTVETASGRLKIR